MVGAVARNLHTGSRSEVLADYLFSGWGTVTPTRRQDDYGVDLHCTLTKPMGQRAVVTDYYSVQVKSNDDPWKFETADEIKWVFEYPTPLFLACVDKSGGVLSIYHTMPRFLAGFYPAPSLLELTPTALDDGECAQWAEGGQKFSLSAPILRVSLADLLDEVRLLALREVLQYWVTLDSYNCDLRRMGLLRFRMPDRYRANEAPLRSGTVEQGMTRPTPKQLARAVRTLFEAADCVGDQLRTQGDRAGAIRAALLTRHLRHSRPADFETDPRWQGGASSGLEMGVSYALNTGGTQSYVYENLDKVATILDTIDFVARYLKAAEPEPRPAGGA
jgi:hypothetical protein